MRKDLPQRRKERRVFLIIFLCVLCVSAVNLSLQAQYTVEVQVVDLQVSVTNENREFVRDLKPEDFFVWEDGVSQDILDLELTREPFSIGILLDTSFSMRPAFKIMAKGTEDFIWSLHPQDEFFLMTFDEKLVVKKDFGFANQKSSLKLNELRYGEATRLFDAILAAEERLKAAHYPRRALFIISDGLNTSGEGDLKTAIEQAQKSKIIVYSMMLENSGADIATLRMLSDATGGSYFELYEKYPRLQAAYDKIARDLANRFTLYYRSRSDYNLVHKPEIKLQMKKPRWHVQFQKAYFPH